MNDNSLAKVMAEIEEKIGKERLSALRRQAARQGVSVITLLGEAVMIYVENLSKEDAA